MAFELDSSGGKALRGGFDGCSDLALQRKSLWWDLEMGVWVLHAFALWTSPQEAPRKLRPGDVVDVLIWPKKDKRGPWMSQAVCVRVSQGPTEIERALCAMASCLQHTTPNIQRTLSYPRATSLVHGPGQALKKSPAEL